MTAGQPSKYSPAYCNEIIQHCSEGLSIESFAAEIGVTRSTIANWAKQHPEFLIAVTRAKAKSKAAYEKALLNLAKTGTGNATACIFAMTNLDRQMNIQLHDPEWQPPRQKMEHSGPNGDAIKIEQVKTNAKSFASRISGLAARRTEAEGT